MKQKRTGITVFYSYAETDRVLRDQLAAHLSQLKYDGLIEEWHDQQILAGSDRAQAANQAIQEATIILLLISADFLASDYCYDIEMQHALDRHKRGDARVIPIILRPCDWRHSPVKDVQCLPPDGKPVTEWQDQDMAFLDITNGLRRVIEEHLGVPVATPRPEPNSFRTRASFLRNSSIEQQNRERLIRRVRSFWIKGVFEKSLHHATLMTLGLEESPAAVENPWRLVIQESEHTSTPLPAGTRITEVYDDASEELLILGEPGAGKTTLLLELARDLLGRAEEEQAHPIPVIFNLSSWTRKRQPLATWLIEELETKYQAPRKVGSDWISTDQILPLLDGLDEVDATSRPACMQAINDYHHEHSLVPLVVCCRVNEYMSQANRLALYRAVTIQPLTTEQINAYFARVGEQIASLCIAFQTDPVLQELAATPLMLTILILAYQGSSLEEIEGSTSTQVRQQRIFATYTQRMLSRRSAGSRYGPQETIHWLSYLAQQLKQDNQTEFYIERIQKHWLPEKINYRLYLGITFGGIAGLFVWLTYTAAFFLEPVTWIKKVFDPLYLGIFIGTIFFLLYGVLFAWLDKPSTRQLLGNSNRSIKGYLVSLFKNRIFSGIFMGSLFGLFISQYINPFYVASHGLAFGIAYVLVGRADTNITPAEMVTWSWKSTRNNLVRFFFVGLCFGLFFGLIPGIYYFLYSGKPAFYSSFIIGSIIYAICMGIALGLGNGITFMLIDGISHKTLDESERIIPNQGIHRSIRNSVYLGLASGLSAGSISALIFGPIWMWILLLTFGERDPVITYIGLSWGGGIGIAVMAVVGLRNGGMACLQHFVLRFLLWHSRSGPFNYPYFLDYAAERILLRKVGGGYIFVHRLLLEYFAAENSPVSTKSTSPMSKVQS